MFSKMEPKTMTLIGQNEVDGREHLFALRGHQNPPKKPSGLGDFGEGSGKERERWAPLVHPRSGV
jgi:hypothetical protein